MALFLFWPKLFLANGPVARKGPQRGEYEVKTYSRSEVGGRQGRMDSVMAAGSAYSCPVDSFPAPRLHVITPPDHKTRNERTYMKRISFVLAAAALLGAQAYAA